MPPTTDIEQQQALSGILHEVLTLNIFVRNYTLERSQLLPPHFTVSYAWLQPHQGAPHQSSSHCSTEVHQHLQECTFLLSGMSGFFQCVVITILLFIQCRDTFWVESFNYALLTYLPKHIHFGSTMFEMRMNLALCDWVSI